MVECTCVHVKKIYGAPEPSCRGAMEMLSTYGYIKGVNLQPIRSVPPCPTAIILRCHLMEQCNCGLKDRDLIFLGSWYDDIPLKSKTWVVSCPLQKHTCARLDYCQGLVLFRKTWSFKWLQNWWTLCRDAAITLVWVSIANDIIVATA